MHSPVRTLVQVLGPLGLIFLAATPTFAQSGDHPLGPSNSTELGLVVATGNAKANTIGLRNVYRYRWPVADMTWESGWVRASSRDGDRVAVARATGGFDVVDPPIALDSQRLFTKVKYTRRIQGRHDWFTSVDASRDEPSNISRQVVIAGGLGTVWIDRDDLTFKTSYGVTYTDEDLVVEGVRRFGGYRICDGLEVDPAEAATVQSELTLDGSVETVENVRADWLNGISVDLNATIALKSGFRVLFRNVPALEAIDLRSPDGVVIGEVDVPKRQFDTSFTTSLVFTF